MIHLKRDHHFLSIYNISRTRPGKKHTYYIIDAIAMYQQYRHSIESIHVPVPTGIGTPELIQLSEVA
jgi:hypothetical protein